MNTTHNIVYMSKEEEGAKPSFNEVVFEGVFADAVEHAKKLAMNAKFMLGQVLAKDGKVLATVAPQGSVHISQ